MMNSASLSPSLSAISGGQTNNNNVSNKADLFERRARELNHGTTTHRARTIDLISSSSTASGGGDVSVAAADANMTSPPRNVQTIARQIEARTNNHRRNSSSTSRYQTQPITQVSSEW